MLDCQFCIHAGKDPVIFMNQLKSIYNRVFHIRTEMPIVLLWT